MHIEPLYIPILKGKAGELKALAELSPDIQSRILPVIEVPEIDWDYDNDRPKVSLEEHVDGEPEKLRKAWASDAPVLVDPLWVDQNDLPNTAEVIRDYLEQCASVGLNVIPVTGPGRTAGYQYVLKEFLSEHGGGLALRVTPGDLDPDPGAAILDALKFYELQPSAVHLIMDMGSLQEGTANMTSLAVSALLSTIPHLGQWATLSVAGSAFPETLSDVGRDSQESLERTEWLVWERLRARQGTNSRLPLFGDYAIAHPGAGPQVAPWMLKMSAHIRYTTERDWLIIKGKVIAKSEAPQQPDLCRILVRRPDYAGPGFSWGDGYISDCAEDDEGPGNPMTWRAVGTSHHITMVVRQIATVLGLE